jgi:predicted HTH domain antitoxin
MVVQLQVPDDIAAKLEEKWSDVPRCALEALAVDAYREGVLTAYEVQRLLGLSSRWKTEEFLKEAGADLGYTEEDLEQDTATLRRVLAG